VRTSVLSGKAYGLYTSHGLIPPATPTPFLRGLIRNPFLKRAEGDLAPPQSTTNRFIIRTSVLSGKAE